MLQAAKKLAAFGRASKRPTSATAVLKAPEEAVEGARRGGLKLCLLGMLCHDAKRRLAVSAAERGMEGRKGSE